MQSIAHEIVVHADEEDRRLELLHENVRRFGTAFDTVARGSVISGTLRRGFCDRREIPHNHRNALTSLSFRLGKDGLSVRIRSSRLPATQVGSLPFEPSDIVNENLIRAVKTIDFRLSGISRNVGHVLVGVVATRARRGYEKFDESRTLPDDGFVATPGSSGCH